MGSGAPKKSAESPVEYEYPQPPIEPEVISLAQQWAKLNPPPKTKTLNRWIYGKNIEVLQKRIAVFKLIVDVYNREIKIIEEYLSTAVQRASMDRDSVKGKEEIVENMWDEYRRLYRGRESTPEAQRYRNRIIALQNNLPKAKKVDQYVIGKYTKYYYDLGEAKKVADARAGGGTDQPKCTTVLFEGNLSDLVDYYEDQIEYIEDNYLEPLDERLKANQERYMK